MSCLKPYPKYKPSGVEWLGDVPVHWEVKKVAWHMPFSIGWTPSTADSSNFDDDGYPWVTIGDMASDKVARTEKSISHKAVIEKGALVLPKGTLLFSFKLSVGLVAFLGIEAFTNEAIAAFKPNRNVDLKFLYYAAPVFIPHYGRENIYGALLLNQDLIASARTFMPSIDEQAAIAAFLDRETGRIDALVEKKRRFIELLKEKRQALITAAVTGQIDVRTGKPYPAYKPSGVAWLGDVPKGWSIKPLKTLFRFDKGKNAQLYTKEYVGVHPGDFPVYSGQTEDQGLLGYVDRFEYDSENVIFVTTVGAKAMTTSIIRGKYSLSQNCARIIPISRQSNVIYFEAQLQPLFDYQKGMISLIMQPSLRFEDLNRYKVVVPPTDEQSVIATFLDRETGRIDALIEKTEQSIELLREKRAALITAAVTGKIDVRGNV